MTAGMTAHAARIAAAFVAACRDELDAPKPGNVHVFADGHRMTAADFVRSAQAAAGPLTASGARVGLRILRAVEATHAAVGTNTNLGIILLCAPLAAAAEHQPADLRGALAERPRRPRRRGCRSGVSRHRAGRRPRASDASSITTCGLPRR